MVSSTRKVVAAGVVAVAVCCVALLASTSKSVVLRQQTLDGNYKSASEAQSDLASYFDKQATHFKVAPGMSATAALRQANSIFDNKEKATLRSGRSGSGSTQRKEVTQDLAFSSKDSKNDIDDYFDNLGGGQSHHAHKSTGSSAKYINSKRAAMDDGDNFASINADGSRSQMKDKWSSAAAAKEMDSFFDGENKMSRSELKKEAQKAENTKVLAVYRENHPEFVTNMENVHKAWMKSHDSLPKSSSDKAQYKKLMESMVGNMGTIMKTAIKEQAQKTAEPLSQKAEVKKEALTKYLDEHPEVKAKIVKAKAKYYAKYKHPPSTQVERDDYKRMMAKYVGHIDVSVESELGDKAESQMHAKAPQQSLFRAADADKAPVASGDVTDGGMLKVFEETMKKFAVKHGVNSVEALEEAQKMEAQMNAELTKKGFKVQQDAGDKKVAFTAPLDPAMTLKVYTSEHPELKAKIDQVHKTWRASHKAPPQNAQEEKEYSSLMTKIVGKLPKVQQEMQSRM